ncbi:unnamed protein product [Sphagnum troendelagicum]|uniref:Dirigent protein n=2 Tax=Sphagnum TaxID=13804 RepID=A0ABP0UUV6_9BRYO
MAPGPGPGVIPWAFPSPKGEPLVFYYTVEEFIKHITEPSSEAVRVPKDPPAYTRERLRCVLCGVIKTDRRRINRHRMAGCPKASPPYSPLLPYISFAVGESYKEKRIVAGIEAGEDVSKLLGLHQQYHPAVVELPGLCAKREASDSVEMEVDEQARKHKHVLAIQTTVSPPPPPPPPPSPPPKSEGTLVVAQDFRRCSPPFNSMLRNGSALNPAREAVVTEKRRRKTKRNKTGGGGVEEGDLGSQKEPEKWNVMKEGAMEFFVHEIRSGGEATLMLAAGTGKGDHRNLAFGSLLVFDNEVREGGSRDSKLVGRERGFGPVSDLQGKEGVELLSKIAFNADSAHGVGTLTFSGNFGGVQSPSELIILGGTGRFRGARGYALVENCPAQPPHFIFHWNVYLNL